jgi:hypothetical protein
MNISHFMAALSVCGSEGGWGRHVVMKSTEIEEIGTCPGRSGSQLGSFNVEPPDGLSNL